MTDRLYYHDSFLYDFDAEVLEVTDSMRALILDNAAMWIRDYHFDGLRLDAVQAIGDQSAVNVLEAIATEVHRLGDELGRATFVIAESNLMTASRVADRLYAIDRGEIIFDGPPRRAFENSEVMKTLRG